LIDGMCDALAAGDGAAAYATIDRVAEAGHDARRFAADLLERFRDLIVMQQVPDSVAKGLIDGPADQIERMTGQAGRLGPATLSRCADIVHTGLVEMRGTTAPRLLLELITARMLLPGADDTTGALLQRLERMERRLTLTDQDQDQDQGIHTTPVPAAPQAPTAPPSPERTSLERTPPERTPPNRGQSAEPVPEPGASAALAAPPVATITPAPAAAPTVPAQPAERRPGAEWIMPDPVAPDESAAPPPVPGRLSAAAIRDTWPEIVSMVGRRSKKIAALAQGATVRDLDGDTLVLTFRFPVHAQMLSGQPDLVLEALYEVLGGRWQIRCEVSGDAAAGTAATRPAPARPAASAAGPAPASASSPPQAGRQRAAPAVGGEADWPEPARPGGAQLPGAPPPRPVPAARPGKGVGAWSDGAPAEEPPYDPEFDGPPGTGPAARTYEGFDPGDEPLDDVVDDKTVRQSSEQQAMRLLQDAFGAEKIGEV
jgi:DNA polymerase III subunit gamma/tau